MSMRFMMFSLLFAFISTLAVVRHTRQNEEAGRTELIGSTAVGRFAPLSAALIVAVGANVVMAIMLGLLLAGIGLPIEGSFAVGAALAAIGITFAGFAAITAQLTQNARGANGLAAITIGAAFVLRAVGDVMGEIRSGGLEVISAWPTWLSPIGWGRLIFPYYQNNWWILGLFAVLFAVLVSIAFALNARRDVGAGVFPDKVGPPEAPNYLLSPLGLAWRLQRTLIIAWALGLAVLGGVFGGVLDSVGGVFGDSPEAASFVSSLGGSDILVDAFIGVIMSIMGWITSVYAIQALLRLRGEEEGGHLESILASKVSRGKWLVSHMFWTCLGVILLLVVSATAAGVAYGLTSGDMAVHIRTMLESVIVQAPAIFVIMGAVLLFFGVVPRLTGLFSWSLYGLFLLFGQFGELLKLPQWLLNASPYTHLPSVPTEGISLQPMVALLLVAVLLGVLGLISFRRRDISN
jgi:ABC-2 type transport system permease protein